MSNSPRAPLRTLLETHRRRLDALAPADLHSIIVEAPEPDPPTPARQEDPDAGDPDFLPLPPRLSRKAKLDSQELAGSPHEMPFKRRLIYLGDVERLREYHRVATDLSQVLSDHYASIFNNRGPAPSDVGNSESLTREISMIYILDSVGAVWAGHAWTIAVHHLLEGPNPEALVGRYAWWKESRPDDLPVQREEEYEDFAASFLRDEARRDQIAAVYALKNDLVVSSILAIDAILDGQEVAGERPRVPEARPAGQGGLIPSRSPADVAQDEPIRHVHDMAGDPTNGPGPASTSSVITPILASQSAFSTAMGFSKNTAKFLEKKQEEGVLRFEQISGRKYCKKVWFHDPIEHEKIRTKIEEAGPNSTTKRRGS